MRVLVLGAAVSGRAAARLAKAAGDRVVVFDGDPDRGVDLLAEEIAVVTGDWDRDLLSGVDLVVASPGFSIRSAPCLDAVEQGVPLVSELEFGARHLTSRIAAVTGTNGKTTVTELAAAMLTEGGVDALAAGNIGTAVSEVALAADAPAVVVVESSSFQLATIDRFRPEVAVLLNVAPDHLDWHGSFASYAAAKARIFENQRPSDRLVYGADDPRARELVQRAISQLIPVAGTHRPEGGAGPEAGTLAWQRDVDIPLAGLARTDPAFLVDVAAAMVVASHFGARPAGIVRAAEAYRPAAHRRRVVSERAGITYVDDSKATNPHAALASVASFASVVLIAGGRNKGLDLTDLATAPTLTGLVTMGESAREFEEAAQVTTRRAATMDEAVAIATTMARPGDTVLLAPGCASFDMFDDYGARGEAFVRAVMRLLEGK